MDERGPLVRWRFIHGARTDLAWYIGSSLAGWLYIGLVLALGRGLANPIRDPFYAFTAFGHELTLSLGLVVIASWAILIDAPHVWATLARTWLDPDAWRADERRAILFRSTLWFALGPALVLGPYLVGPRLGLDAASMAIPAAVFFVFFRLWAYYHVVRQHWGFLVLYKKRNDDLDDPTENRADSWFFNATLYLPLLMFMAAPWYDQTGMPSLGVSAEMRGLARPALFAAYPLVLAAYAWYQLRRYREGRPRNGPKLLFLASIVPLHLVVFLHPLLALFIVPVVTVGHNLQYHRIVWEFARNKYRSTEAPAYRWPRFAFRSVPVYLALGLAFTLLLYQGPWIELVKSHLAHAVDGLGLLAGVTSPASAGIGARVAATLFLGWAMQHYYLDSKIWRVRRDPSVSENLKVS